jgi:hypothetical protein
MTLSVEWAVPVARQLDIGEWGGGLDVALEAVGGGQVRCLAIWGKRLTFHLL